MAQTNVIELRPATKKPSSQVVSARLPVGFLDALDLAATNQGLTRGEYLRNSAEQTIIKDLAALAQHQSLMTS